MKVKRYLTGPIQVNTYLTYDDTKKGFIVDPGGYSEDLINTVRSKELSINYIILTHGHGDHIGGIGDFMKEFPDIKVIAYIDEKEILNSAELNSSVDITGYPITMDADIYVKDNDKITIGNTVLTFIHTPGHTPGGMCIATDGFVFSGDTLFRESIGRTDFYGGNFNEIIKSIKEKLFCLPEETVVLPGHMGETTIGHEKEYNPFV